MVCALQSSGNGIVMIEGLSPASALTLKMLEKESCVMDEVFLLKLTELSNNARQSDIRSLRDV